MFELLEDTYSDYSVASESYCFTNVEHIICVKFLMYAYCLPCNILLPHELLPGTEQNVGVATEVKVHEHVKGHGVVIVSIAPTSSLLHRM